MRRVSPAILRAAITSAVGPRLCHQRVKMSRGRYMLNDDAATLSGYRRTPAIRSPRAGFTPLMRLVSIFSDRVAISPRCFRRAGKIRALRMPVQRPAPEASLRRRASRLELRPRPTSRLGRHCRRSGSQEAGRRRQTVMASAHQSRQAISRRRPAIARQQANAGLSIAP